MVRSPPGCSAADRDRTAAFWREAIAVAGYNQDRAQILMADLACHITGTAMAAGKPFIAHDCDATRGTSGGPLLVRQGGGWAVIGINIGAAAGANLALPATAFAN